jgi:L-alanine-DL-glutamate epimerase-like enolase superfamily enzyme
MIKKIVFRKVSIEMKKPFKIALGSTESYEGYFVSVESDDGTVGYGEATTTPFITGDTLGSIEYELSAFSKNLIGMEESPELVNDKMKSMMKSSKASRNAIDCALWDIIGKKSGQNLKKILGNHKSSIATSYTVDLVDAKSAEKQAIDLASMGIKVFKIKMGSGIDQDVERVRVVRDVVGSKPKIYVDFNQAYTPKMTVEISKKLRDFNIEFLEQPVPADDISGLKFARDNSDIPIFADESIFTKRNVADILSREAADGINVKLMKSGGISDAIKMVDVAESFGVPVMIGCMVETRLANTSGLIVALSRSGVKYADLDGYNNIAKDSVDSGILMKNGEVVLERDLPGVGAPPKKEFMP